VSNVAFVSTNFLFALGYVVGLGMSAALYAAGAATIGTVYLIATYTAMLFAPLEAIRGQMQDLQRATASVDRVAALFDLSPDVRDAPRAGVVLLPPGPLAVQFEHVSFRYDIDDASVDRTSDDQPAAGPARDGVIRDVSFRLDAGRVLGVLGRTGSGKTTLTRLLFRLYDPTAGVIRLGGVDVRTVALATLRRHVGMVTQDVQLFQASVRDNVVFFSRHAADDRIAAVLDEVGLGTWLRNLPQGLDTTLSAGGQGLSAGEAQLLALARAFRRDPGVLVLDEASSRLDPATERRLEHALDRLLRDRTAIVIAHRLATVRRCDDVQILEDGRVVEHGQRTVLEADPHSRFSQLLRAGWEVDLDAAALPAPNEVVAR
jgi:ATP-binding cassette subfamily B protein